MIDFIIYLYPLPLDLAFLDAINSKSIVNAKRDEIDCGGQQRPVSFRLPSRSHHHGCFLTSKHISIPSPLPLSLSSNQFDDRFNPLLHDSRSQMCDCLVICNWNAPEIAGTFKHTVKREKNACKNMLNSRPKWFFFSNIMLLMIILTLLEILAHERLMICPGRGLGVVSSFCTFYSVLQMMKGKIM